MFRSFLRSSKDRFIGAASRVNRFLASDDDDGDDWFRQQEEQEQVLDDIEAIRTSRELLSASQEALSDKSDRLAELFESATGDAEDAEDESSAEIILETFDADAEEIFDDDEDDLFDLFDLEPDEDYEDEPDEDYEDEPDEDYEDEDYEDEDYEDRLSSLDEDYEPDEPDEDEWDDGVWDTLSDDFVKMQENARILGVSLDEILDLPQGEIDRLIEIKEITEEFDRLRAAELEALKNDVSINEILNAEPEPELEPGSNEFYDAIVRNMHDISIDEWNNLTSDERDEYYDNAFGIESDGDTDDKVDIESVRLSLESELGVGLAHLSDGHVELLAMYYKDVATVEAGQIRSIVYQNMIDALEYANEWKGKSEYKDYAVSIEVYKSNGGYGVSVSKNGGSW